MTNYNISNIDNIHIQLPSYPWQISPNTYEILSHFDTKFGQLTAPVGLAKVLTTISPFVNPTLPNLNIFHVAPTRQFKSLTSKEAMTMTSKKCWIDLGDDVTMNSILERFNGKIGKKCLFINDATTLFATKSKRAKDRLISGLSVLLSEGRWFYGERMKPENLLEGEISIVMNMAIETYNKYESKLLGSTLLERFLTLFHTLPTVEMEAFIEEREDRIKIRWRNKIKFKKNQLSNIKKYKKVLTDYAERYSALSMKSFLGCYDQISALITSHAALNERDEIVGDDIKLLRMLEPYLINPFAPNQHRIVELRKQGRSHKDICLVLGRDPEKYRPYVSRVIRKARERGVLQ